MYVMNKYLWLPTSKYIFCYWAWGVLRFFNQISGDTGPKCLRNNSAKYLRFQFFAVLR